MKGWMSLGKGWRGGTPGVGGGLVGDEHRGHGPDAQHFPDGGLQQQELVPVADARFAAESHFLVNLLMDLLLQLRARAGCA